MKKGRIMSQVLQSPLLEMSHSPKGGFTTLPFIIGNLAFMSMASSAVAADMIVYLMKEYHMDMASGSNLIYFWSALTNSAPVIGAFLADSLMGRFRMIGFGSVLGFLGMMLLWVLSVIPQARPSPCSESTTTLQLFMLCSALVLFSIGCGGMRTSLAFGADQLKNLNVGGGVMESYFSWYYAVVALSVVVAMTGLVYVQENMGWELGFGILVVLMFLAALSFFMGSPFYVKQNAKTSLITGLIQVIVASYTNRHLRVSSDENASLSYHCQNTKPNLPTQKLRFLNKACIIQDPERDLTADGQAVDPWRLCTVEQVEELKALIKVIPIWTTGAIVSINVSQSSFSVLQASSMDRHIGGSRFEIPAGSVSSMISFASVIIWIVVYDRLIIPTASRIRGKPVHFSTKSRMGFGLFVSFLSMVAVAAVEGVRRRVAIEEGHAENPSGVIDMSILWVAPQYALMGFAGAINGIAQNEFYISEFPESMSSIASNLSVLGAAVGSVLASLVMSVIDELSRNGEESSWISSNINKGHYDYFHWVLAGISMLNFVLFIIFSKAYGPYKHEIS